MIESQFSKEMIQCPVCLNEEPMTIWHVINVSTDPDLKDRQLRKELQTHRCSNCGNSMIIGRPLLYIDPDEKLMFYCHSGQDENQTRAALAAMPGPAGWQLRTVESFNQLNEKIHIADHHCDDRLIEFIKLAVSRHDDQEQPISQILFLTADDQAFRFVTADQEGQWYTLDLESTIYLNAESLTHDRLPDISGQWLQIGPDYAEHLLQMLAADQTD